MKLFKKIKINLSILQPLIAIMIGFLVGAIAIAITGESIIVTYKAMWEGAFGNLFFTFSTLARSTPILLSGLGVALAFRAGFFNLGGEGQMVLGAVSAALAAIYVPGPPFLKIIVAILVGMLVGGLYALLAAWMDVKFKVNLLISTLLMNYIAVFFSSYLVAFPFKDNTGSAGMARTVMLPEGANLPKVITGMSLHWGFALAILAVIILFLVNRYTVFGYEVRIMGHNPFFASYGGMHRSKIMMMSVLISGGLAGLAGTVEVMGTFNRYVADSLTIPQFAWTGMMAALLANSNPVGTAVASIFLAALQTGSMGMERHTNVPLEVGLIIQAVLILFISAKFSYSFLKRRKESAEDGTDL